MSTENASVLVLLVASNAESWLPDVIEGVRNQTYDEIDVLAVDNASTDRSRPLLAKAFGAAKIVTLDRRVGYGRALAAGLKVAAERGSMAEAFLLLHDDAAMDPQSVAAMVEALGRERVGVVGAKLVDWSEPEQLLEVGLTTDRFGRIFNPLEAGELDHGQHDGLKEVFYCSSACLLVGREVVEKVGLFDLRYAMLRDDFDFCWRARLAGFRTVVTTGARARHVVAGIRGRRPGPVAGRVRYFSERNMFSSLIKNYGIGSLLVALPVTLGISIVNAVLFSITGRRSAARQTFSAVQWNLVHLPSTLRLRTRSQRRRTIRDRDVTKLMMRGTPRVRSYVAQALEKIVGEPAEGIDEEGPRIAPEDERAHPTRAFVKAHPVATVGVLLGLLYLIGARHLIGGGGLAGADFAPFPAHPGDFFGEFFSGWRSAGTGGAAPASPALFLYGLLSIASFGSAHLAERIVVLSLIPLAAASASSCAKSIGFPRGARWAASIAYAISPLALAMFSQGLIPDLVLFAALPVLLLPAFRAGGFAPRGDWRSLGTGVIGLAVVASVSPYALPAVAGAGFVLAAAMAISSNRSGAARLAATALAQSIGATILLLPWSVELFKPGSLFGAGPHAFGVPLTNLVRTSPGGSLPIPGPFAWAFPAGAAAGLALAVSSRDRLAKTLAISGTGAVLLAWAVSRGTPWIAPRPALPLALAGLAIALLAGIAVEGLVPALSTRSFGAFHLGFGALGIFVLVAFSAGVGFLARGDLSGLKTSGDLTPAFFSAEARQLGDFQVLWLDGTTRALSFDLADSAGETALTYAVRRAGAGHSYLTGAVSSVLARQTEQGGRLLAPLGVRYVVLRPGIARDVAEALSRQVDLSFAERFRGAEILENEAWLPVGGAVSSPRWAAASLAAPADSSIAAASLPLDPGRVGALHRERPGRFVGSGQSSARSLLLAQEYGGAWRAETVHGELGPARSFGWATSFPLTGVSGGPLLVTWTGQVWHRLALLAEVLMLVSIGVAWSRRAAFERGER